MATALCRLVVMDDYCLAFGAHLRSIRQCLGLSQEEVAHLAGVHVTYLSGIERGRRNPSLKNIRRLAQALDTPVRELFSFDDTNL